MRAKRWTLPILADLAFRTRAIILVATLNDKGTGL
jgi:hypothetical protein